MKNKFITILVMLVLNLCFLKFVVADEFIFEVTDIEIIENGNIYKGNNRGKIISDNQIEITSNNFEYLKKINQLEANGDVQLTDIKNNITINAEKIFYLKNEEKVYTVGKTLIKVSDKYNIVGYNLTLLKNTMTLFSNKKATITDNYSNIYKLDKFEYAINQEILKGEKIEVTTNYKKYNSDKYFFETGFFNLKENKFLAKDINVKLHKTLYGNAENDPRINAVSGYGDEFNNFYEKGIFTSCKKTDKCPPWKITSKKIQHDRVKKKIIYKDAWLEIYDYPVIYFPKFFHPDPSVKRQSGFLTPELGSSNNLGSSIYTPYFYVISENRDITIKPRLFGKNKLVLQNEFRQKNKNSITIADFSITAGHDSNQGDKGNTRSHFFTNTIMDLSLSNYTSSMLEINYEKTSNDNYLKLFNLDSPLLLESNDLLESIIKLDLEHEDYDLTTSFKMYETLSGSSSDRYQYVFPSYSLTKNFNYDNLDGSFNFNSSGNNTLRDTNVSTSIVSNDLNYTTYDSFFNNGVKTNFEVSLKNINTVGKNSTQYKDTLQSELMSSYVYNASIPLIKSTPKNINTFEPKLSFKMSPHEMKDNSAQERRVDINNIFSTNRLGMGDSFEAGESITFGLNFKKERVNIKNEISEIERYFNFKLATVYRFNEEKNIPINSTLNKKRSNIFGQYDFYPTKNLALNYNFSLTEDLKTFEYNSIIADISFNNFTTQFNYLEETGVIGQTNIVQNITRYNFNEENSIVFNTRRNRNLNLTEYYDLVYEYKNDCLIAGVKYKKNYYNDADIKPVEELFFTLTIVPLTTFSPDKLLK
ncbi:organic solvent tolerance protein [Candidatus Pelagibacter sp.]|nr:organic solvent tolerance protein [Candidatus Pelagibacter sp.]